MQPAYVILLILLMIYVPIYVYVRAGRLERYGLVKYGPAVMIRTGIGKRTMERLGRHRRFWRAFGTVSKLITLVLMAFIVFIVVIDLMLLPQMFGRSNVGIEYVLAIPGLNPMLPLAYGVVGLVIAMAVHELAHGIQSRANDIDVESSGLLYAVVPVGAFVEPDAKGVEKAGRRARMDMYSAGIATNAVLAAVIFLVMSAGMLGSVSSSHGDDPAVVGISSGSPAYDAGIPVSAIMLDFGKGDAELDFDPDDLVAVRYLTEDGERTANMRMGVYVSAVTEGSPAAGYANGMKGKYVRSITSAGDTFMMNNMDAFLGFMGSTRPGQVVTVELVSPDGGKEDATVTLGARGDSGFLGIGANYSGMMFSTPNAVLAKAGNPFDGVGSVSELGHAAMNYVGSPFRGYSPIPESVQWWYDSVSGDGFWIAVQTLYWIFWLNLILAVFNALPAVPFDGGFLFQGGVDWLAERMGMEGERRERLVGVVTFSVSNLMIFAFALIVIAMIL